jgi:prepilin-type N-terminal cleavage/methylation domain-containing protein
VTGNRPTGSDAGFTLIEVLIAMIVLSLGVMAVLGALRVGVDSGRVQRDLSTAELTLRSLAEHVKAEPYVDCAAGGTGGPYWPAWASPATADLEVLYLSPGALGSTDDLDTGDFAATCAEDAGLQLIHLGVELGSSSAGSGISGSLETSVVKRRG